MDGASEFTPLLFKVIGTLMLVVALMLLLAWSFRRWGLFQHRSQEPNPIRILNKCALGPKHHLLLVEALGSVILVGMSPEGFQLLNATSAGRSACPMGTETPLSPHPPSGNSPDEASRRSNATAQSTLFSSILKEP
jgi:flagellar biogenesis protein FliO